MTDTCECRNPLLSETPEYVHNGSPFSPPELVIICRNCSKQYRNRTSSQCRKCRKEMAVIPNGFYTCLKCDRSEVQVTYSGTVVERQGGWVD